MRERCKVEPAGECGLSSMPAFSSRAKHGPERGVLVVRWARLGDELHDLEDEAQVRVVVEPDLLAVGHLAQLTGRMSQSVADSERRGRGGSMHLASRRCVGSEVVIAPP